MDEPGPVQTDGPAHATEAMKLLKKSVKEHILSLYNENLYKLVDTDVSNLVQQWYNNWKSKSLNMWK